MAVFAMGAGLALRQQAQVECENGCSAKCPKVLGQVREKLSSLLPKELTQIIGDYACDAFEDLDAMTLCHDLVRYEFFREGWAKDGKVQTLREALRFWIDKSARKWFVLKQTFEGFGGAIRPVEYRIRFIESTQEYECIVVHLGVHSKEGAPIRCANGKELAQRLDQSSLSTP